MQHADPFARLAASGQRKLAAAGAPVEGIVLPPAASPTHEAVGGMLDELLGLLDRMGGPGTPQTVKLMLSMVKSSRGMMVDGLASLPPEQLVGILRTLRDRIDAVPGVAAR